MLAVSVLLALVSLVIAGIQLIGASSDGAYAVQLIAFTALIAWLLHKSRARTRAFSVAWAAATAAVAAVLPLEVMVTFVSDLGRSQAPPQAGEAYVDADWLVVYPAAVATLFAIHAALLVSATRLARKAYPADEAGSFGEG